jgi:hypothetical protein
MYIYRSACKVLVSLIRILIKIEFFRHVFEKPSNIKFHVDLSSCSQAVPCGQTDRCFVVNEHNETIAMQHNCMLMNTNS